MVNCDSGWDRLTPKVLNTNFNERKPDLVIFSKLMTLKGKPGWRYGLRSNNKAINVVNLAQLKGGNGWQNGTFSTGGFSYKKAVNKYIKELQNMAEQEWPFKKE